jgi:DNA-binding NtrC family response regulator
MRTGMIVGAVTGAILVVGERGGTTTDVGSALEAAGLCVLTAREVSKAMAFLEAAAFDVVVVDAATADGARFAEYVRIRRPFTQIVAVPPGDATADDQVTAVRDALERGRQRGRMPDVVGRAILARTGDPA